MSEFTDFMTEQFFAHHVQLQEECEWRAKWAVLRHNYPRWVTREGKEISIVQMTDTHLNNTIAFLERKNDSSRAIQTWLRILRSEKYYREHPLAEAELREENEIIDKVF